MPGCLIPGFEHHGLQDKPLAVSPCFGYWVHSVLTSFSSRPSWNSSYHTREPEASVTEHGVGRYRAECTATNPLRGFCLNHMTLPRIQHEDARIRRRLVWEGTLRPGNRIYSVKTGGQKMEYASSNFFVTTTRSNSDNIQSACASFLYSPYYSPTSSWQ
jgi:hypothetical protein